MALLLLLVCGGGFLIAYHTYGKYLGQRIFRINPDAAVPSRTHEDGTDFVPTKKAVIFGHHYTSIAGTGPIVGPAIGLIWAGLPALLWVFFDGSIFIGAVHDFGSLIVSMRNEGESLSEIAAKYINKRVRLIFFIPDFPYPADNHCGVRSGNSRGISPLPLFRCPGMAADSHSGTAGPGHLSKGLFHNPLHGSGCALHVSVHDPWQSLPG